MNYNFSEEEVRNRIKLLMAELKLNENKLAAGSSPTQKRLNRQLSHGASITLETILLILNTVPSVSAGWLLKGKGEMYENCDSVAYGKDSYNGSEEKLSQQANALSEDLVREMLAVKDQQINKLLELLNK